MYIFSLKWSVSDNGLFIMVNAKSQIEAFNKVVDKYPECPNIDYHMEIDTVL